MSGQVVLILELNPDAVNSRHDSGLQVSDIYFMNLKLLSEVLLSVVNTVD